MTHSFDTEIAAKFGVNAAVIFQSIRFWIEKNEANEKHFHDGRYWTYCSVKGFEKLFPYLTSKQIRSALEKLESDGLLISGNYNQSSYDRTKWFAISGKPTCPKEKIHLPKKANEIAQKGKPIPDISKDISTDIRERTAREEEKKHFEEEGKEHMNNLNRQPRIPTKIKVLEIFSRHNGPGKYELSKEQALAFFSKHDSVGWFLNSSPIVNWESLVPKFIINWERNNQKSEARGRDKQGMDMQDIISKLG